MLLQRPEYVSRRLLRNTRFSTDKLQRAQSSPLDAALHGRILLSGRMLWSDVGVSEPLRVELFAATITRLCSPAVLAVIGLRLSLKADFHRFHIAEHSKTLRNIISKSSISYEHWVEGEFHPSPHPHRASMSPCTRRDRGSLHMGWQPILATAKPSLPGWLFRT